MRRWLLRWGAWLAVAVAVAAWGVAWAQTAEEAKAEADKLEIEAARLYQGGSIAEAIPKAENVVAIRERVLGPEHADLALALGNVAAIYRAQGRAADAEQSYRRALAIYERVQGARHPYTAKALGNLADLFTIQARFAEAEPLLKRSLTILEAATGPESPEVARRLTDLAALYFFQGRYGDAEPLWRRSLAIWERVAGPEHRIVATTVNNLAVLYKSQGRIAEAEPLYKRSLAIWEKTLGLHHPTVATALNNLAEFYRALRRYDEAEPLYERSRQLLEATVGPNHPDTAKSVGNIAQLRRAQGRIEEARALHKHALSTLAATLGPEHPDVGLTLNNLAWLGLDQMDYGSAADYWRQASQLLRRRAARGLFDSGPARDLGSSSTAEVQRYRHYFSGAVKATHRVKGENASEMFETAQWAQASQAAASLAQMAARSAGGSPELAALVRERQDLVAEWQVKDKLLISSKSKPPANRNAEGEKTLSDRLAEIDARFAEIDARFAKDFPDYAALTSPKPIALGDVQATLRDDEALLLFLDTDAGFKPLPEETFVWVVTRADIRWLRSPLGTGALKREVAALRCGLDATAWIDATAWPEQDEFQKRRKAEQIARRKQCVELTGDTYSQADQAAGKPFPFDTTRAHALYKSLLEEAEDLIAGKHLLVVPSGALTTLPFQVLVKSWQRPQADHAAVR